jgi:hypothetical protein
MMTPFTTTDLSLAAFLKLRGLKLLKATKTGSGRFEFIFEDNDQADSLALEFANSEFSSYDANLRALKKMINSRAK